jgi:hypothetical protein
LGYGKKTIGYLRIAGEQALHVDDASHLIVKNEYGMLKPVQCIFRQLNYICYINQGIGCLDKLVTVTIHGIGRDDLLAGCLLKHINSQLGLGFEFDIFGQLALFPALFMFRGKS